MSYNRLQAICNAQKHIYVSEVAPLLWMLLVTVTQLQTYTYMYRSFPLRESERKILCNRVCVSSKLCNRRPEVDLTLQKQSGILGYSLVTKGSSCASK